MATVYLLPYLFSVRAGDEILITTVQSLCTNLAVIKTLRQSTANIEFSFLDQLIFPFHVIPVFLSFFLFFLTGSTFYHQMLKLSFSDSLSLLLLCLHTQSLLIASYIMSLRMK